MSIDYDKLLLSACAKDIKTFKKTQKIGFHKYFFTGEFEQYTFSVLRRLSKYETYDSEAIMMYIAQDKELAEDKKSFYASQVEELFDRDVSNVDFAIDVLRNRLYDKEMRDLVQKAARQILSKEPADDVYEAMAELRERVKSSDSGYETYDYYKEFEDRRLERFESLEDSAGNLKLVENLSPFGKYFTRGLAKEEITAIGGPTYSGKSILLSNFINIAVNPVNKLNVLYIFAENRMIQALSRIDAIILDRDYEALFIKRDDPRGTKFMDTAIEEGWGNIRAVKVVPGSFTADDIQIMIDEARDEGFHPDVLAIDSPDHQMSIRDLKDSWRIKGQVYWDLKALITREKLICLTSLPMKASSVKSSSATAEDVAGSYDISRIVDNLVLFNPSQDDAVLGRVTLQIPKNREGKTDKKNIEFRVKNSLKVIPWEEFEKMGQEVAYMSVNGEEVPTKFVKNTL
jgi:hypothetical protein